jgi:hypothetical protein
MRRAISHLCLIAFATIVATPALWAQGSMSPWSGTNVGGEYKDPTQKAADAYSRGMKAKRKAEGEKDPKSQRKLLEKAKDELGKSVGYTSNYDALVALGQVQLALGEKGAALHSCTQALSWKPNDPAALACQNDARQKTVTETKVAVTPGTPMGTEAGESAPPQ